MEDHFNSTWLPLGAVPYHEHLDKRFPSCDEQCIPKGHPHDLSEFSNLFGTQTTTHYDRSHDDACLDKNGCPGLGLDAGMDNSKSHPHSFEPWDRAADSSNLSFALMNVPEGDRSSLGCSMTLSLSDECCDSSCLDEDACSTGTCDPDTFCRDENCPKPQVGHDVAHGAIILQEISGAKPNQQHTNSHIPSPGASASAYPYTPQSMAQSTPFAFDCSEPYLADQLSSFQNASDEHQTTTSLDSTANYASALLQPSSQSFGSAYHHLCGYGHDQNFANTFGQQTHWDYNSSPVNTNFNSSSSNLWTPVQEPLNGFNFNAPLHSQPVSSSYDNHLLDGDNVPHAELLCRPIDAGQLTPSHSLLSATATPSPAPELASSVIEENGGAHNCQWIVDGGMVCGKQFNNNRELHDHIAGIHVENLQADGQDGFICRWAGCTRQTDGKYQHKRGFNARSKLKRHLTIHTGPVETHTCPICGKDSVSSQALSTHLVTHSDARPYKCNEKDCGKTFKTADSLKVHKQNVHSSDKRYVCPICEKAFRDSSNFSKHKATHSNEKPWSCRTRGCHESFARRDQLIRHASKMHNESVKKLNELYPIRVRGARASEQLRRPTLDTVDASQMMASITV